MTGDQRAGHTAKNAARKCNLYPSALEPQYSVRSEARKMRRRLPTMQYKSFTEHGAGFESAAATTAL